MVKVTLGNLVKEYESGTSYESIMRENYPEKADQIILVNVDHKLEELQKKVKRDCKVEPVWFTDQPGYNSYRRSVTLLMLKAIYSLYTKEEIGKVRVEFSAGSGYFCTLSGSLAADEQFAKNVETRMKEYVAEEIPITKEVVDTKEAISRFAEYGMGDKAQLFKYRRASKVNIYSIRGFQDYYYGYMVPNTSYLKWFALESYEDGFMLQFPKQEYPTVIPPVNFSSKVFQVLRKSE